MILKFDGQPIDTMRALPRAVAVSPVGKSIDVEVWRDGVELHLSATIGRLPAAEETPEPEQNAEAGEEGDAEAPDHEELLGLSISP